MHTKEETTSDPQTFVLTQLFRFLWSLADRAQAPLNRGGMHTLHSITQRTVYPESDEEGGTAWLVTQLSPILQQGNNPTNAVLSPPITNSLNSHVEEATRRKKFLATLETAHTKLMDMLVIINDVTNGALDLPPARDEAEYKIKADGGVTGNRTILLRRGIDAAFNIFSFNGSTNLSLYLGRKNLKPNGNPDIIIPIDSGNMPERWQIRYEEAHRKERISRSNGNGETTSKHVKSLDGLGVLLGTQPATTENQQPLALPAPQPGNNAAAPEGEQETLPLSHMLDSVGYVGNSRTWGLTKCFAAIMQQLVPEYTKEQLLRAVEVYQEIHPETDISPKRMMPRARPQRTVASAKPS